MDENLAQKAIKSALDLDWHQAIKINKMIIQEDKEDIDALNRLAHAYFENGDIPKATKTSKEVLKLSPNNNIAKKSLERYAQNVPFDKQNKPNLNKQRKLDASSFIEESGKTKLTTLINLGSEKVYSCLNTGDEIFFNTHAHKISVTTVNNKYIGKLTDDLSARLRLLIKGGNKYKVLVKSASKDNVRIFIKGDIVSFPREISESVDEFSSQTNL